MKKTELINTLLIISLGILTFSALNKLKVELLRHKVETIQRISKVNDDIIQLLETQNIILKMHVRDVSNIVDSISSIRDTLNTKQDKQ